jgi:hypothetical protein
MNPLLLWLINWRYGTRRLLTHALAGSHIYGLDVKAKISGQKERHSGCTAEAFQAELFSLVQPWDQLALVTNVASYN